VSAEVHQLRDYARKPEARRMDPLPRRPVIMVNALCSHCKAGGFTECPRPDCDIYGS
jgi:hypothetical protein